MDQTHWLAPYWPDLNLIEHWWGHLKRTVIANVLYSTPYDMLTAFRRGVRMVDANRNQMGFTIDHGDVTGKKVA